jgi:Carboxyltransferase domain, subdomain A and B
MRFRDDHQDPEGTDLSYGARINGFDSVEDFITAHPAGARTYIAVAGGIDVPVAMGSQARTRSGRSAGWKAGRWRRGTRCRWVPRRRRRRVVPSPPSSARISPRSSRSA